MSSSNNNKLLKPDERLKLDELMRNNPEYIDKTEHIRKVKHSKLLITSVGIIEKLEVNYANIRLDDPQQFIELCHNKCPFLYNNYTEIFNKLIKDELDLQILSQFLQVLRAIEESQIDQTEGSVIIGKLLKELYIDSVIKQGAKLDSEAEKDNQTRNAEPVREIVNRGISWSQYKHNNDFLAKTIRK